MRVSVRRIQEAIASDFGISLDDIRGASKVRKFARPRHYAMFLSRELTPLSLPSLGRIFKRDHTTIMNGIQRAEQEIDKSRSIGLKIEARALLLQCEPNKSVEGQTIGFIGLSASAPDENAQPIHRGFPTSILDDRTAEAA
jgi:hypothetical protein